MRIIFFFTVLLFVLFSCEKPLKTGMITEPVDWVNPLMGTLSDFSFSSGNTYPAIARPWGMNFWSPQTGKMGDGWMYTYSAKQIRGFKQTHQPSPWINDYGQFSIFATTGKLVHDENLRASWFSHKAEIVKPYYYQAYLADYDVTAEITPTERAACFRFTFPENDSSCVLIDAFDRGSKVEVFPGENKIIGYTTRNSGGVPSNFKNWFVVQFDKPFTTWYTWKDEKLAEKQSVSEGFHTGAIVRFHTSKGEKVHLKVASSFISSEQAELNLQQETAEKSFDQICSEGRDIWNKELGKILVSDENPEMARTFYSCLYRILLFPRKFYEQRADGKIYHYSPYNGEVLPGVMFTDNGFWDTFRAVFPFFTWMYPELDASIMEGLVNAYLESGWLPEWASPGHRNCMIGSNSASLIADAYLKGISGYQIDTLYAAILKNSNSVGPVHSVGRYGAEYYNQLGYVPYDVGINENCARTLEYAYADFCISELAKALGKPAAEVEKFRQRAQNFRNVFDPESRLMRGKNKDGAFQSPFSPYKWGDAFTEGNSWHYTWSVFHDIEGLKKLMGGTENFTFMLDSLFKVPPVFDCSYYGFPIHEIREMQTVNMGNYAHGNQPAQHIIYLYNYAGQSWKTQQHIREALTKLYQPTPDGYCGDEDNGQTSAWYVFSSLGFYPVCPGTSQYVIGSPLFEKSEITLSNGKKLIISSPDASKNPYIQSLRINGKISDRSWISHEELTKGGEFEFRMGEKPNKNLWNRPECFPFSMSGNIKKN
jgi:predicted alpha-1,2-mannosidase